MKTLILTEKPSVGRDFASALNITPQGQGYYEGNGYIITWAIGHLLEPKPPAEYDRRWKVWMIDSLPILPPHLEYKEKPPTKQQLEIVQKQLSRSDLSSVILATDAGREGELIGRLLLQKVKVQAKCYRFWTSQALSKQVILETLANLTPLSRYDRLYHAGKARQTADWLVGMNLSRLATIKMGDLFSVGRVQTAVLALLVERRQAIDSFRPEKYFRIQGTFCFETGLVEAYWINPNQQKERSHIRDELKAKKVIDECTNQPVTVADTQQKEQSVPPPFLFSLTDLQKEANRQYGFSAQKTLQVAQALYERHKCLSYPRTDAKVLGTKSYEETKTLVTRFRQDHAQLFRGFDPEKLKITNRRVFNDDKLTDHHALVPYPIALSKLRPEERQVYNLVLTRFAMVFSKNYSYQETKLSLKVSRHNFEGRGLTVRQLGWKTLEKNIKDKTLPPLRRGDKGLVRQLDLLSKMTQPPLEYTDALLLHDMTNPARLVERTDLKQVFRTDVGLGTQSTRSQIIETLLNRSYVERKGKHLKAKQKGQQLIERLRQLKTSRALASPSETAKWEIELDNISQGNILPDNFLQSIRQFILACTEEWKHLQWTPLAAQIEDSWGSCPLCEAPIIESKLSYCCFRWREGCRFTIWKTIAGKRIPKSQIQKLLKTGRSDKLSGFRSKSGKSFDASLKVKGNGLQFF